jgi:glutathione S-transferase
MGTPEYDQSFKNLILKDFPAYLQKLEGKLSSHKYAVSDTLTLADFSLASRFFQHAWNDDYAYCHIL